MGDYKSYREDEFQVSFSFHTVYFFSVDTKMVFGLNKSGVLVSKRGKNITYGIMEKDKSMENEMTEIFVVPVHIQIEFKLNRNFKLNGLKLNGISYQYLGCFTS